MIEPNATGTSNGIHIVNGPNSPIRRALGHLSAEAKTNLSRSMGDRTQGFVEDLAAMRNGTLDIMQMHRLRSDLLRTKRQLANSADPSGWKGAEIDDIVDAIDDTMFKQDWVRTSTGKKLPARKLEALKQYEKAREASKFVNDIARSSSVQDLIHSVQVFDPAVGRAVGHRRRFKMEPTEVHDMIFQPRKAGALQEILDISGHHPGLRAALGDNLEAIYKRMVINEDGTFARGGYNRFMEEYGDHVEKLFGPERASKIMYANQMKAAVDELNVVATKVEDAFKHTFGDAVDPQKLGANGVVQTVMGSSGVTSRQTRELMKRLRHIDPDLHQSVRAEFAQWAEGELSRMPVQLKQGNAMRTWLGRNQGKIRAVMGDQYFRDVRKVQKMLDLVDLSDLAKNSPESVSAAWLQVTRSVFGPLSRKQRFMTAANRIFRGRSANKAMELMADPEKLRGFVQLGKMEPGTLAFWQKVDSLGLRYLMEDAGLNPPNDLGPVAAQEESLRRLAMGGPL
jgi:hypothetical protein